jgi:DMSO/TMAO reductase YedYZ molybdopterin-dependent catalytic subunit
MKRSVWLTGALVGLATSLVMMATSYLGSTLLGLPFLPFDLFDWLTRVLPGGIIKPILGLMISIISALHIGSTDTIAKLAEQIQALGLMALTGVAFGLVLTWVGMKRRIWLERAGLVGGAILWVGMVVVEASLPAASSGLFLSVTWLLILLAGWGWQLSRLMELFTRRAIRPTTEAAPSVDSSLTIFERQMTRRNMLALAGTGAISVVILYLGLEKFHQAGAVTTGGSAALPPAGGPTSTPHHIPYGPEYTSGPAASPSPAALAARFDPAPGTRPEITSVDQFYRVDINAVPPQVDGNSWRLNLTGLVKNPISLTLDEIWARPSITQAVTLSCISNLVGGDLISSNYWTGIRFKDILTEAGVQPGAQEIAITAADGFYEGLSLEEAMDERTLLVYAMNGDPLTAGHGFPLRLYVPGHYGMKLPKWITQMEVVDHSTSGFWVDRGWSATAVPQTTSVVDTDGFEQSNLQETDIVPLGGIAWAGARGISKVEVQIDDQPWVTADLRNPAVSPLTWVQWRYNWNATTGTHNVQVRATDGTGALQDLTSRDPSPEGATGIDSVQITV